MRNIDEVLGPDGLLAREVPGFAPRQQQLEMARVVADTLDDFGTLIAEAGTGTGKTFAYLVPALLSGRKVIVSTGTRNLQDQLFLKDLPRVRDALASPARIALLKGRSNYLCPHRLDNALLDPKGYNRQTAGELQKVREWAGRTERGDIAELVNIPEDAQVWPLVTSTTENCLGQDCPALSKCHLLEARKRAQEADLVVINHHLLCADFAIKDDGFGELLPDADAFIIDEAHQLPEVASNFFGLALSTRQFLDLARDTRDEYVREAGDLPKLVEQIDQLIKVTQDFRLTVGTEPRRGAWQELAENPKVMDSLDRLRDTLSQLAGMLEAIRGRGKGLDSCHERCEGLRASLDILTGAAADAETREDIRWYEVHKHSLRLNSTPLEISSVFRAQMNRRNAAWVFTSATLAVGDSFKHFQMQLGLDEARTARWDSPFDYQQQALWFVPRGLPEPNTKGYTLAMMQLVLPILEASGGRAFLLFTSYRALNEAADWLETNSTFELLVQGDAPKAELLDRFVKAKRGVLLGTASFWEGVDVRGEALSLVVIDKLPFASPGDPVLQARLDAMKQRGLNPFMHYQVPQAAIALKQGAGRLIRDVSDRGVLVICDPRLLRRDKPYGKLFLDAMPSFARTRELADVVAFFEDGDPAPAEAAAPTSA
jgi:ATP-dependent DNA helicase DinG